MKRIILLLGITFGMTPFIMANIVNVPPMSILERDTNPDDIEGEVFNIVEVMPVFGDCPDSEVREDVRKCSDENIINFVSKNMVYPKEAMDNKIEGTAVVRFVINEDGSLEFNDKSIIKDPGGGCGAEAVRVLKKMPNWTPGLTKGKPVKVQFTMPVRFRYDDENDLPIYKKVAVKWGGKPLKGKMEKDDPSKYTMAECSLEEVTELLNEKVAGLPIRLTYGEDNGGFNQYYLAVGKEGKKYLIYSDTKNKTAKKNILKDLKKGDVIYFYNWQFKKKFFEIKVN